MNDEQYSNMVDVEGFTNKDSNALDKKIKEKSTSGKKNTIGQVISLLVICLGLAIIISYLGATLLFFIWSIGINNCSKNEGKNLFEYIFPTFCNNQEFCEKDVDLKGGSSFSDMKTTFNQYKSSIDNYFKDVKECVKKNEDIKNFCNTVDTTNKKLNWNDPGLYEWFLKSNKETNYFVNGALKTILKALPSGSVCGITFAFAWLFYFVLLVISLLVMPLIYGGLFLFNNVMNGFDYFMNKNKDSGIVKIIKLGVGLFISFSTFLLIGSGNSISLMFKMLFYPLVIGGSDIILKIINQNFFMIRIILIIMSIVFVALIGDKVNKNIYTGIIIGYIPLLLINLWSLI